MPLTEHSRKYLQRWPVQGWIYLWILLRREQFPLQEELTRLPCPSQLTGESVPPIPSGNSLTLPAAVITRRMWLLSAKYTGRGRKLGSKRNAICCLEMLRISYFKSQTWIHRTGGRGGKTERNRRNPHNLLHLRAVNSRPAQQEQQCANNPNWLQNGKIRTTLTQQPQAAKAP